ncbi:MAG TPA: DNA polymerase III subunit delta' [Symbiobacteriaceae bacterium]|nr:DNA polymerase III subunit delta' [Symbiobacteriaceae bacterium]
MSWAAIVGQPLAVRLLRQAVAGGKVAHAYLFVGPAGVGKRTVAMELAKTLNCQAPLPEGGACDCCASCRKINAVPVSHPDVRVIAPEGRMIKTGQIGELQQEMYARPNEGRMRVAIIDGADAMNDVSANRLLKLLEEPPAYAVLILLTHNLSGILPTLISRSQVVNFPPLSPEDVAATLRERFGLEAGQARLYAALSGGSIGRAVALSQDAEVAARRDQSCEVLQKLSSMDDLALIGQAEALDKAKEHLDDWLDLATAWLRDALILSQTGSVQLVINADRVGAVNDLADSFGSAIILEMLSAIAEVRGNLQRNANSRLALDVLMLRLGEYSRKGRR